MKEITIHVLNSVYCHVEEIWGKTFLNSFLNVKKEFWKKGKYHKERKEYTVPLVDRKGFFLTGFLPRIERECERRGIKICWSGPEIKIPPFLDTPKLEGINLRPDQQSFIYELLDSKYKRGGLVAPTGVGKTVMAGAIIQCFPESNCLFICHTGVRQAYSDFHNFGFKSVGLCTEGQKEFNDARIIVATRQTFIKIDPNQYSNYFDVVIHDEGHHFTKFKSEYATIFSNLSAPVRIWLTATPNDNEEAKAAVEGFIGPLLKRQTIQEAHELGILAMPKIKIVKTEYDRNIRELTSYRKANELGVIHNRKRNIQIWEEAKENLDQGKCGLIFVVNIDHGKILEEMGRKYFNMDVEFIYGDTKGERREEIRQELITGKRKCIIASTIWMEIINIPRLNFVIRASTGKDDKRTLQIIGRGLRKTDEKDTVTIIDFFDPSHPSLVEHFGHRISLYCEEGWL